MLSAYSFLITPHAASDCRRGI